MTNLTIAVDEHTLRRARIRALEEDTSVNAVLRDYLELYAGSGQERREAWARIQSVAKKAGMSSGGEGLPGREELYDRDVLLRGRSVRSSGESSTGS